MSTRDALTARIKFLNERIDKLQAEVQSAKAERATAIAERDALTEADELKVASLAKTGVVKVQP